MRSHPDLLLDNGGDLFARFVEEPWDGLLGGTEETTSGRMRLEPLRDRIGLPVLVINDSPIKQFAENEHAVGQSVLESFLRLTNLSTNGKRVTVFGYGACGRGVAANFRNAHAIVSVVERDPVKRLQAMLDGFLVPERDDALRTADVVITVTGAEGVVTAADAPLLRPGAVLANAGHFPWEIDAAGLDRCRRDRSRRRPHGEPRRAASARQLGRVDGPRLRASGALLGGGRPRRPSARKPASCRSRARSTSRSPRASSVPPPEAPSGLNRQMSRPFQLGTQASPRIVVTTNGPTPALIVPVTVFDAGSTTAIEFLRICGTHT